MIHLTGAVKIYTKDNLIYHTDVPNEIKVFLEENPNYEIHVKCGEFEDHSHEWLLHNSRITCSCNCSSKHERKTP